MDAAYAAAAKLAEDHGTEWDAMNDFSNKMKAVSDNRSGSKTHIPGVKRATGTKRTEPTDPTGDDKALFIIILLFVAGFPIRSVNALWKFGGHRTVAVRPLSTPLPRSRVFSHSPPPPPPHLSSLRSRSTARRNVLRRHHRRAARGDTRQRKFFVCSSEKYPQRDARRRRAGCVRFRS